MRIPHITDALGLLAYFFCGYAAFLVVWTIWKRARPKHAERWMRFLLSVRKAKKRAENGFLGMRQGLTLFAFLIAALIYGAVVSHPPTEEYVAVIRVVNPYRFTFQHVDRNSLDLVGDAFTEDICHDYAPPGDDFREGLILKKVIHTEEGCWSLNPDKHCGFFKLRDPETTKPIFLKEYARNQYD
jgi:hypothetical protein